MRGDERRCEGVSGVRGGEMGSDGVRLGQTG